MLRKLGFLYRLLRSSLCMFCLFRLRELNFVLLAGASRQIRDLMLVDWLWILNFLRFSLELLATNEYFFLLSSLLKYPPLTVDLVPALVLITLLNPSKKSLFLEST